MLPSTYQKMSLTWVCFSIVASLSQMHLILSRASEHFPPPSRSQWSQEQVASSLLIARMQQTKLKTQQIFGPCHLNVTNLLHDYTHPPLVPSVDALSITID